MKDLNAVEAFSTMRGVEHYVFFADGADHPLEMRSRCLEAAVRHLRSGGLDRLVLDHVQNDQRRRDRVVLARSLKGSDVSYSHEPPRSTEPALWMPDATAWCSGRPDWRTRLKPWVAMVEV